MQEKILNTTAVNGLGYPTERMLLKVESGQYSGRLIAVLQTAPGVLKYTYSDFPYASWSTPTTIATDASDQPFDCIMDEDLNIHLVYSESGTDYLVTRKLTYSNGLWSVGSKVTIYNGDTSYFPSVTIENSGKLWVAWTKKTGGVRTPHVKSSSDGGAAWGSGASDAGAALTAGASSAYVKLLIDTSNIHAVYTEATVKLAIRSLPISGGSWTSEYVISSGTFLEEHFDLALGSDKRIGIVWDDQAIKYCEYNGDSWSAIATVDAGGGIFPQLKFSVNTPLVIYLSEFANDQKIIKQSVRQSGIFSTPAVLDGRAKQFDSVVLYETTSSTYEDLTSESSSAATGDIIHSGSSALVASSGDIIYLGMDEKFCHINILLSTAGTGGGVSYSYWDGNNWSAFTPAGSGFNLDSTDKDLLLWTDFSSMPQDWQKKLMNNVNRFWLKIEVTSSFSTPPVGSQITAISNISTLILRR
ncbi:MAG: hypothetical protein ABIJ12_06110 [bacterium]